MLKGLSYNEVLLWSLIVVSSPLKNWDNDCCCIFHSVSFIRFMRHVLHSEYEFSRLL